MKATIEITEFNTTDLLNAAIGSRERYELYRVWFENMDYGDSGCLDFILWAAEFVLGGGESFRFEKEVTGE